jgi:hypothetical protein
MSGRRRTEVVYSPAPSGRTEVAATRSGTAGSRSAVPPETFQLERLADGGFRLLDPRGGAVTAHPAAEGLRLPHGLLRRRTGVAGGGYLLEEGDEGTERGRSMRAARGPRTVDGGTILLADGRLFVMRSAIEEGRPGFELCGWEVSGAYVRAEPAPGGWALALTPAGTELPDAAMLVLLFAAELADADGQG